jgi:hypothetical protein
VAKGRRRRPRRGRPTGFGARDITSGMFACGICCRVRFGYVLKSCAAAGVAILLIATAAHAGGNPDWGGAELRWIDGDLVLKMTCVNPTEETVDIEDPRNEFQEPRNIPGVFGDLTIKVYSPDGVDRTAAVFHHRKPWLRNPSQLHSAWGSWIEPKRTVEDQAYQFALDLKVQPSNLPQAGWKVTVKYVGLTPAQLKKRFPDQDDPDLVEFWNTGKWPEEKPEDVTVVVETAVIVPPKSTSPEERERTIYEWSLQSFWNKPAAPQR